MRRIALYIRVSTEEQARIQDGSLVSQRKRLEEYVEGQLRRDPSWGIIVGVYIDEGKSAKDLNRPEFQKLLNDVRFGKVNLILATELSRMSRSIRDFCDIWDLFKKHNANFITLREQFDTTSAAGEMMVFNLINFAQFERKQTAERISANFKSRAERGLWNGGQVPLGFKRNPESPGKLLVDKKEALVVKEIFKTFLETKNLRETCRKLNTFGYRTKAYTNCKGYDVGGNLFTVQSLHHLLTNASYLGMREINKTKGGEVKVKAQWDAIIEKNTFSSAQRLLEKNKRRFKPDSWKTYPYPLSGIAVCGECGKSLNGKSAHGRNKKHHYYDHPRMPNSSGMGHEHVCRIQRLRAPKIEELVLSSLKSLLADPIRIREAVQAYLASRAKESPINANRVKCLKDELRSLETKQKNLINRISELPSGVSADLFYDKLKLIGVEFNEKQKLLASLEAQSAGADGETISAVELENRIKRTVVSLEKAPVEKHRGIFENVIQFAEFYPDKLKLGVFSSAGPTAGSHTIKIGGESGI